jgi:O-antigen/teichoic acid export membrane protein
MSLKLQAVKNVTSTWLGLGVHAAVGFFLSPFILHRLGDEAFSLWVLVFALTGYFGLLDLGIRSSIVRYTAKFIAANDTEQLSRYLSTSLAFYSLVAVAVVLMTTVGFFYLNLLFRVPASSLGSARILFLLAGASVALTFPLSVFAAVLEGLQKFAWLQLSQIGITLFRAVLIIAALTNGGGLLAIGTITVAMNLLSYLIFTVLAIRALPVRLSIGDVEWTAFRAMVSYGVFALAVLAAERLRFQSDAMVIGAFLSSSAVTLFSIGSRLVDYSSYAVKSMTQIFTPMSSHFHEAGDMVRLQRIFIVGNRACAFIMFPLCITLVILGRPIIESWVGARYLASYSVLVLLVVPRSLYLAQSTSIKILVGMSHHRVLASVLLLEGGVNLLFSVLLVRRFGIVGVALGTAIPLTCTSVLFLPRHLCRLLGLPLGTFLRRAYRLPLALCAPLAAVLWFTSHRFPVHTYSGVVLELGCGAIFYGAGLGCALFKGGMRRTPSWQAFAHLLEPE